MVEVIETVDNTNKLLAAGAGVVAAGAAAMKLVAGGGGEKAQDFLEAEPYWDQSSVPVNVYKNKSPFTGKVVSTKRIVGPKATGETCHIVIDHKGDFPVSKKYGMRTFMHTQYVRVMGHVWYLKKTEPFFHVRLFVS